MDDVLARSERFTVVRDREIMVLRRSSGEEVRIGQFPGDTRAAVIDWSEQWCVMVGNGLVC